MKLQYLELGQLKLSALNVRKHGGEDVSDLLPTIRGQGILQSLLVRPDDDRYEVIAGKRRYTALTLLAQEGPIEPVPCIVMEEGDDAAAIEASLAENIARLPMDELDQYGAFADLIGKGRNVEDIASHFGVTERLVRQRLALANLDKRILVFYRRAEISADTLRVLTLATKAQQKAWLKRFRDPDDYAPQGRNLRQWLLGGQQIATSTALFPIDNYKGAIVTDLFGEDSYFANPEDFWALQKEAIAEAATQYQDRGWAEVVVLEAAHFPAYEYRKTAKAKGGKVYMTVAGTGEVAAHEGYLSLKEVRQADMKAAKGAGHIDTAKQPKLELTKAATNYVDLHRHAAVQSALLGNSGIAMRLVTAHMIAGSSLWAIKPEAGRADKPEIKASVEASAAKSVMEAERKAVLSLLGYGDQENDDGPLVDHSWSGKSLGVILERLVALEADQVVRVMTYAMAETLAAGSELIDDLGAGLNVSMAGSWQADAAFLGSVASKATLIAMLTDIGGTVAGDAHKDSPAKTIRSVIGQFASGEGRPKAEGWVPPYLTFPQGQYFEPCETDSGQMEPDADEAEMMDNSGIEHEAAA